MSALNPLHLALETLNELLAQINERFAAMQLGVRASIPIGPEDKQLLTFGKFGDKWIMAIEWPDGHHKPLLEANMQYRVEAVPRLTELLAALRAAADGRVALIHKACDDAEHFLKVGIDAISEEEEHYLEVFGTTP